MLGVQLDRLIGRNGSGGGKWDRTVPRTQIHTSIAKKTIIPFGFPVFPQGQLISIHQGDRRATDTQ